MALRKYGYEYFAGANVVLEIEGMPILEAAGFSYQISESRRPIYGYSSRFFDTVARGQVLVQGSLVVNYVHQDYLFRAIELGLERVGSDVITTPDFNDNEAAANEIRSISNAISNEYQKYEYFKELVDNYPANAFLAEAFREKYWENEFLTTNDGTQPLSLPGYTTALNPHDAFGSLGIRVTFGERSAQNNWSGSTGFAFNGVYFVSRGTGIQIDEHTIVEEYQFLARNVRAIDSGIEINETANETGYIDNPFASTEESINTGTSDTVTIISTSEQE
jgi:hypothetical protein